MAVATRERSESMIVKDSVGIIQDLVSPDLKAAVERLNGLGKEIAAIRSQVDKRITSQDALAAARHNELLAMLETYGAQHVARYDPILKFINLDLRLKALEDRDKEPPPRKSA
jgi:hypothetical protein